MTARILFQTHCERKYYKKPVTDWFKIQDVQALEDQMAEAALVTDLVTVDISARDLARLIELERLHETAMRDPRVRDAWEKYQLALILCNHLSPQEAL